MSGVSSEESDGDPSGELAGVAAELVGGPFAAAFTKTNLTYIVQGRSTSLRFKDNFDK